MRRGPPCPPSDETTTVVVLVTLTQRRVIFITDSLTVTHQSSVWVVMYQLVTFDFIAEFFCKFQYGNPSFKLVACLSSEELQLPKKESDEPAVEGGAKKRKRMKGGLHFQKNFERGGKRG